MGRISPLTRQFMLKDTYILFVKPTKVDVEPKKIVFCATRQGEVAKKKKKKKKGKIIIN
jgi:hypothetical protein